MPGTHAARDNERDERPLATYFELLPRETAQRGSFTPDEVAEIVRRDRERRQPLSWQHVIVVADASMLNSSHRCEVAR